MSDKFKDKYRIPSARLNGYDYTKTGAYFITICTNNHDHLFGNIIHEKMNFSEMGKIIETHWLEIPEHFPFVILDEFVVMPNHIHGILIIDEKFPYDDKLRKNDELRKNVVETLHCNVSTEKPEKPENSMDKPENNYIKNEKMSKISPKPGSISTIIRSYKSICTKMINITLPNNNFKWQERFHDHIIRNENELYRIRNYIRQNPGNWKNDK
jgi:putative transposase